MIGYEAPTARAICAGQATASGADYVTMPIDPAIAISGPEWTMPPIETSQPTDPKGFGAVLADQLGQLGQTQQVAAQAARDLATGASTDPASAVMAVERARLSMQLAAQVRTKGVEAVQSIFSTQV